MKPCRLRMRMTPSGVSRGIPASPNFYLDHMSVGRQRNISGLQVETDGFFDICSSFKFRVAEGCATGKLRAHGGIALRFGIVFEHDSEPHRHQYIVGVLSPTQRVRPNTSASRNNQSISTT